MRFRIESFFQNENLLSIPLLLFMGTLAQILPPSIVLIVLANQLELPLLLAIQLLMVALLIVAPGIVLK